MCANGTVFRQDKYDAGRARTRAERVEAEEKLKKKKKRKMIERIKQMAVGQTTEENEGGS